MHPGTSEAEVCSDPRCLKCVFTDPFYHWEIMAQDEGVCVNAMTSFADGCMPPRTIKRLAAKATPARSPEIP